jgi:hypothetical protein
MFFLEVVNDIIRLFGSRAKSVQDFSPVGERLARLFNDLFVGHVPVVGFHASSPNLPAPIVVLFVAISLPL